MHKKKLFAVTGKPVFHSRSPRFFNSVFRKEKIDAVYSRLTAETAEQAIQAARAIGLSGFNVTAPFKEDVMRYLDRIDPHASVIRAVNCVVFQEGGYAGYNTDFLGVLHALEKNGIHPGKMKAAVLGAGGAARAVLVSLAGRGASEILVANRYADEAVGLVSFVARQYTGVRFRVLPLEEREIEQAVRETVLCVQATSAWQ